MVRSFSLHFWVGLKVKIMRLHPKMLQAAGAKTEDILLCSGPISPLKQQFLTSALQPPSSFPPNNLHLVWNLHSVKGLRLYLCV